MTETALLQFVGRLHPLLLHLPIGLWLGIAVLEFGGALVRRRAPRATVATLAWLAAITGAASAVAGWVLAQEDGYAGRTLELHRWLGVAAAAVGVLAAALSGLQSRRPFKLLLAAEVGTLLVAGHLGSEMARGTNWLSDPFVAKPTPALDIASAAGTGGAGRTAAAAPTFAAAVLPVLEHRCGKCHGESKQKGELALHTEAAIQKGGENGPVLAAGKPAESELLRRLLLPPDDEDHMPPAEKPQPTAAEIAVLRAWIAAGAPFQGTFDAAAAATDAAHASTAPEAHATADSPAGDPAAPNAPTAPPEPETGAAAAPSGTAATSPQQPPAPAAALAALHERLVHAVPVAAGETGLWIDFAAIAPTLTEADVRTLLTPVVPWVQDLGLARVPVGNDLLMLCARMPMLTRLDLRATRVTSAGLESLQEHARLQSLVLAETRLDDKAADALLAMPALRSVHVWKAGLSEPALQRLRQREGLTVETGEQPGGAAVEVEPPPQLVKGGAPAPPASPAADALKPVNTMCPVSGKAVDARFVIVHEQRAIGFCCEKCAASFWAEPAKYPVGN